MSTTNRPTLRLDEVTGRWTVFSPHRGQRPLDEDVTRSGNTGSPCPFCPGHENASPDEVLRVPGSAKGLPWRVRVVRNRFPIFSSGAPPGRSAARGREYAAVGRHEVVIESPEHTAQLIDQPLPHIETVLSVVRARMRMLALEPGVRAVLAFKNHGVAAGASLAHPHWQIIAMAVLPPEWRRQQLRAQRSFLKTGHCSDCALLADELAAKKRLLETRQTCTAYLPFAGRVPYHTRIVPHVHGATFAAVSDHALADASTLLKGTLLRLRTLHRELSFNIVIRSAPVGADDAPYLHWSLDILPRLAVAGGFELGCGMDVNTTLPEDAAAQLRNVSAPSWHAPRRDVPNA